MTKKKVQPHRAQSKGAAQDEATQQVAQHIARLLYLDATPAGLFNAIFDWVLEMEADYLNHTRKTNPDAYAAHLLPILLSQKEDKAEEEWPNVIVGTQTEGGAR